MRICFMLMFLSRCIGPGAHLAAAELEFESLALDQLKIDPQDPLSFPFPLHTIWCCRSLEIRLLVQVCEGGMHLKRVKQWVMRTRIGSHCLRSSKVLAPTLYYHLFRFRSGSWPWNNVDFPSQRSNDFLPGILDFSLKHPGISKISWDNTLTKFALPFKKKRNRPTSW